MKRSTSPVILKSLISDLRTFFATNQSKSKGFHDYEDKISELLLLQTSPHAVIRKISVFLAAQYILQIHNPFILCKKEQLRSRRGKLFVNNIKEFDLETQETLKDQMNQRMNSYFSTEKVLMYYYPMDYNPAQVACTITEKKLSDVLIMRNYFKLPDPKCNLIWVDVFGGAEDDEVSLLSESFSNNDRTETNTNELSSSMNEQEFQDFISSKQDISNFGNKNDGFKSMKKQLKRAALKEKKRKRKEEKKDKERQLMDLIDQFEPPPTLAQSSLMYLQEESNRQRRVANLSKSHEISKEEMNIWRQRNLEIIYNSTPKNVEKLKSSPFSKPIILEKNSRKRQTLPKHVRLNSVVNCRLPKSKQNGSKSSNSSPKRSATRVPIDSVVRLFEGKSNVVMRTRNNPSKSKRIMTREDYEQLEHQDESDCFESATAAIKGAGFIVKLKRKREERHYNNYLKSKK